MKESELFQEADLTENIPMDPHNPLYHRKVCIQGRFNLPPKVLKQEIEKRGGEVISGDVTKNVHYLLLGHSVPDEKLENLRKLALNGYNIKVLTPSDYEQIKKGNYEGYMVDEIIRKDLHLTIEHYKRFQVSFNSIITGLNGIPKKVNPIYGKSVYLGEGITGQKIILAQLLGMVGVYGGQGLSSSTDIIVLSPTAFNALKQGTENSEIQTIQDRYNQDLSTSFNYQITTEDELLSWMNEKFDSSNDSACKQIMQEFIKSKTQ
ncbi:MAG: hypothetical protein K5839_00755 [Treponemataceae bacterium]|nr:hypothetical protein [Treponemataceae bacterium]